MIRKVYIFLFFLVTWRLLHFDMFKWRPALEEEESKLERSFCNNIASVLELITLKILVSSAKAATFKRKVKEKVADREWNLVELQTSLVVLWMLHREYWFVGGRSNKIQTTSKDYLRIQIHETK